MILTTKTSSYEFLSELLTIITIMAPLMVILCFLFMIFIEYTKRRHQSESRTQAVVINTIQKKEEAIILEEDCFDKYFEKIMSTSPYNIPLEPSQRSKWIWDSGNRKWIPHYSENKVSSESAEKCILIKKEIKE